MTCWHSKIRRLDRRQQKRVWVPYVSETSLSTSRWRNLRSQVIAEEPECRIGLPGTCTVISTTVDHIIPRSVRPDLMFVRSNLRGACLSCNSKLGNGGVARSRLKIVPGCLVIAELGQSHCAVCNTAFQPRHGMHKYCGSRCRGAAKRGLTAPIARRCRVCDGQIDGHGSRKVCSESCRAELYARQQRDRYRAAHGLPVDPTKPTKPYERRRPWLDADQHQKIPVSAAG